MLALALAALLVGPLAPRHRLWLEEDVRFLISGDERARFESLSTDEERDRFVEAFWRRRDPTPATLRNEAREAHEARLAVADRLFAGPDGGRRSERGRVYQLLGPPSFRESFPASRERLVEVELWHYTGLSLSFLPDAFYLVFFRREGRGPFRLWNPETDGPESLLRDPEPGRFSLGADLSELARVDPELAAAVGEGLVPGPPTRSVSLLAAIEGFADLAARELATTVRSAADFTRLEASLDVAVLRDDADVPELHYALSLPSGASERLAFRPEEDGTHQSRILLSGRLYADARELDRWEDALAIEVEAGGLDALGALRFSFRGRRLLPSGATRLELSLASPGGGFVVAERALPDAGITVVSAAAAIHAAAPSRLPFRIGNELLLPGAIATGTDALALFQRASEDDPLSWELLSGEDVLWSASESERPRGLLVERELETAALAPGDYRLRARSGARSAETRFRVAPRPSGEERVLAREPTPGEEARYRKARAAAWLGAGLRARAIVEMELAVRASPDLSLELELAALRFAEGRCDEVIRQLRPLAPRAEEAGEPDAFVLLAACWESLGDRERAAEGYARALELSPDDSRIRAALERLRRNN